MRLPTELPRVADGGVGLIAALFVDTKGPYAEVDDCQLWGVDEDARKYRGPHAVIAHPPCERWGRYATGGPNVSVAKLVGDDEQCFASALFSVRTWGGVLEHPADTKAYAYYGIAGPPRGGGVDAGRPLGLGLLRSPGTLRSPGAEDDLALLGAHSAP